MTPIDPLKVAAAVAEVLDRLSIPYVIGGSVASSVLGEPRSTLDLDVMIDADEADVRELAHALAGDFYIDETDAVDAIRCGSSFNAIHFASALKVDFFPAEDLGREQIARGQLIETQAGRPPLYFYRPEDLIIRKLLWFRLGGESSSRQWRDVVSLMKTAPIDGRMLLQLSRDQHVEELVQRAAAEAGLHLKN